jgi:hypothetical protein
MHLLLYDEGQSIKIVTWSKELPLPRLSLSWVVNASRILLEIWKRSYYSLQVIEDNDLVMGLDVYHLEDPDMLPVPLSDSRSLLNKGIGMNLSHSFFDSGLYFFYCLAQTQGARGIPQIP